MHSKNHVPAVEILCKICSIMVQRFEQVADIVKFLENVEEYRSVASFTHKSHNMGPC